MLLFFFFIVVPISTTTVGLLFWLSLGRCVRMRTRKKCFWTSVCIRKEGYGLAGTYVAVVNGTTVLIHRSWYKWIRNLSPNGQWRGGFKNRKLEQMGTVPTGMKGWGWIVNWRESSNRESELWTGWHLITLQRAQNGVAHLAKFNSRHHCWHWSCSSRVRDVNLES